MKRTNKEEKGKARKGEIMWVKEGGGSAILIIQGVKRMIKPGQKFAAIPVEVPEAFRDTIVPLDGVKVEESTLEAVKSEYAIQHKSGGWYDVVDHSGKIVSENSLRKEDALAFIDKLK